MNFIRFIIIYFLFVLIGTTLRYITLTIYPIMGIYVYENLLITTITYLIIYLSIFLSFLVTSSFPNKTNSIFTKALLTTLIETILLFLIAGYNPYGSYNVIGNINHKLVLIFPIVILSFIYPYLRIFLKKKIQ
jgi:hypothetical protein